MTREEASNILDDYDVNFDGHTAEEIAKAFEVAFKALEQEPYFWEKCPYYEPDMMFDGKDEYDMGKCTYKQEPKIVPIAEIKFDEDKLKELVDKAVLTVAPQEPKTGFIPKSVIEDIKAEIKEEADCSMGEIGDGYYDALDIIDKHIGGAKMVDPQERSDKE